MERGSGQDKGGNMGRNNEHLRSFEKLYGNLPLNKLIMHMELSGVTT